VRPRGPPPECIKAQLEKHKAEELRREAQQGLGKPIISAKFKGYQFVGVGNKVHYGKWNTFFEFLENYLRSALGEEWGNAELKRQFGERHPILQWYESKAKYQNSVVTEPGRIHTAQMTGATAAYYGLAYNLYLLEHNALGDTNDLLRKKLLHRLRDKQGFRGAYYETLVAALCINSGLRLKLEDESDPNSDHCEFFATSTTTGAVYSVEAKSRGPNKKHLDVGNQLYEALSKDLPHQRLVFIDVNVPDDMVSEREKLLDAVVPAIKSREPKLKVDGQPAPPAFVIVTNHPFHYDLDGTGTARAAVAVGFKIEDFGVTAKFNGLIAAFKAKQKYADLFQIMDSFRNYRIPATFDGEIPEFAFGEAERRFTIGQTYKLDEFEPGATGILTTGIVSKEEKVAHLAFSLPDGRGVMMRAPVSDAEVAAYLQHPETFFGVHLKVGKQLGNDPLALFEFFYESYKAIPRDRLLTFLANAPDLAELQKLPDDELRMVCCERWSYSIMDKAEKKAGSPKRDAAQ
jgi:hypothetical protein